MQYYNIHTHIFTMGNAPKNFLQLYLPRPVAWAVDHISDTKAGSKALQRLLKLAGNGGKRYADFLRIGKSKSQREVFEDLIGAYSDDTNLKFIALTLNMEFCGAGSSTSYFEGQLEEILNVKKEYADRLLIFLGVDPRWKSTGTEIRKYVQWYFDTKLYVNEFRQVNPFCGIKIYPSTGFYVFDERLKETFTWAADNGVPVLSHCNYLGGIYNNVSSEITNNLNPVNYCDSGNVYSLPAYIKERKPMSWLMGTNASRNNKITCSYFLEPSTYEFVLKHFDKNFNEQAKSNYPLKICLAHFGGDEQIEAFSKTKVKGLHSKPYGVTGQNWFGEIQKLLTSYGGAYTDISFALFNKNLFKEFAKQADEKSYGNRVLFGTDYFLTEQKNPQNQIYNGFKSYATQHMMQNYPGNLWSNIAGTNVNNFLKSAYYP